MKAKLWLVLPLLLVLAGCSTGRKLQSLENKMDVLETKVSSVEQRQASVEGQVGDSRESVGYLKGKVESVPRGPSTVVVTGTPGNNEGYLYKSGRKTLSQRQVQEALKSAGFYNGPIDGKIGKKTKRAIREFQKANGLKADGKVGKNTSSLLGQYIR